MSDKPLEPVWPDEKLERQMLCDADHRSHDLPCHVRALLQRVRDLEAAYSRRSEIASELFQWFNEDVGHGIRNGYWPSFKLLWLRCCKEFGIDPTCYRESV